MATPKGKCSNQNSWYPKNRPNNGFKRWTPARRALLRFEYVCEQRKAATMSPNQLLPIQAILILIAKHNKRWLIPQDGLRGAGVKRTTRVEESRVDGWPGSVWDNWLIKTTPAPFWPIRASLHLNSFKESVLACQSQVRECNTSPTVDKCWGRRGQSRSQVVWSCLSFARFMLSLYNPPILPGAHLIIIYVTSFLQLDFCCCNIWIFYQD